MTTQAIIVGLVLVQLQSSLIAQQGSESSEEQATDINSFLTMSNKISKIRQTRLISIQEFNKMSEEEGTIILDSRSAKAFQKVHVKGAINVNFSDFTEEKLKKIIPSKETRILIYCNNNFISEMESLLDKRRPLALNIPTFINLYGYGYENIFELKDRIPDVDERVRLVGEEKR